MSEEDFFNLERKPKKKGKKDIALAIGVIALIFLLVLGFVAFREYNAGEVLSSASERMAESVERTFLGEEELEEEEEKEEETEEEVAIEDTDDEEEPVVVENDVYTQRAQKGEGLTHLARQALTSHMEREDLDLTDEHRIFIEDYVQEQLQTERGTDLVEEEDEVEISEELLDEAVEEANDLTPEELQNLQQYSASVSF